MSAFGDLSATELARTIRAGDTTAVAVAEATLRDVQDRDRDVHAFVTVLAERAFAAARVADAALARGAAGPLAGVPVAVKDLCAVQGVVRTNGSAAFAGDPPASADATVVTRLRAAGANVVGTTHLHELAFGATGVNTALGTPANPWRAGHVPGGSSSGSAAAVAARLVPAAIGTDTGGSIRVPSSFCGISGLKPTYGRVSRAGVTPLAWTLDHVGPMAQTVEDLALVLGVIAGYDPADPTSARVPVPDYAARLGGSLRGVRIGVPRHFCLAVAEPEVAAVFESALAALRGAGATVADVTIGALSWTSPALGAVILSEATATIAPLLGERIDRIGADVRVFLELGKALGASHYLAGQRFRTRLYDDTRAAMAGVDLLATPTTVVAAPAMGTQELRIGEVEGGATDVITRLTGPFNLTGMPALSVPAGFTSAGLPLGLQLIGRPFGEADLLAAGHAFQLATDWHRRRPPLV